MSIETNTAFSKTPDLNSTIASPRGGLNLRTRGADGAPGFAQVLQAFDASSRDADREIDAGDEDRLQDEASAQSAEEQRTSTPESDDESPIDEAGVERDAQNSVEQAQSSANGADATPTRLSEQAAVNPQASPDEPADAVATTSKQAASLDLLVNRGDQAKLSMRGLVQSLKAQSAPDLTTIAVQTRTGQIEQPNQSNQAQSTAPIASNDVPEPDVAPPVPQSIGAAGRNPGDSLSDQPPQSGRGPEDPAPRQATPIPQHTLKNHSELDASQVDAQQSRSTRVDAAQPIGQPRNQVDFSRSGIGAGVSNVATQNRVDGALTERTVSGIDSGIGKDALKPLDPQTPKAGQLTNTQPESVRASVMAQVQRGLASLLRSTNGDMTLRLTPSHLGTVQISVKRDGDRISLRMTASTPEARDLLSAGSKELMQTLEAKGVKVENFQVDMQSADLPGDSGGASSGFGGQRDASGQQHNGRGLGPTHGGEDVIPFDDRSGGHGFHPSGSIWSELGLDAIA